MPLTPADCRELAVSALRRRDLSTQALGGRLRAAGATGPVVQSTLEWLARAGYVDDARLARARARTLAERGYGDLAIAARLEQEEIDPALRASAIAELEPEHERARRHAQGSPDTQPLRLVALLSRRGFAEESIEAALVALDDRDGAQIR
jgi:SOS response regulatory protein OraA/RecX